MPWTHASFFVLAILLGGSGTTYEAAHPAVYAGTYEVRLCHGSCTTAAYFAGTLVLFGQPLRNAQGVFSTPGSTGIRSMAALCAPRYPPMGSTASASKAFSLGLSGMVPPISTSHVRRTAATE